MRRPFSRALAGLLGAFICLPAARAGEAPAWTLEAGSRIGFVATQAGTEVEGEFGSFAAAIRFDPEDLAAGRVVVDIDIASVDTLSPQRDAVLLSEAMFDVARWPTARFEADAFESRGEGLYAAHARLTMRGVTREVVLPFSLAIEEDPSRPGELLATMEGELTISRLDYGIGQGAWQDTSLVADEVVIRIRILATRPL